MEYFNTTIKTYGKNNCESLRFLRYEDIISRPATDEEAAIVRSRLRDIHSDLAECDEASPEEEQRDWKHESIARAKRTIKEIIRLSTSNSEKMSSCDEKDKYYPPP